MSFTLTARQKELRERIIDFAKTHLNPGAPERDLQSRFEPALWKKCGSELKLPGLSIPHELGGAGLDPVAASLALEALGYGSTDNGLTFSIASHLAACAMPIARFGSAAQQARWFPGLCDGALIGCHAMTEAESGSDAFQMSTVAKQEGSRYRLSGRKFLATHAGVASVALVSAVTDAEKGVFGGVTYFLVDLAKAGVTREPLPARLGLRSSDLGALSFDGVELSPEDILGKPGAALGIFTQAMNWERVLLFASHSGSMQRVLESALQRARTRTQFGQAIGKNQSISHRLADLAVKHEAARLLVLHAASRLEESRGLSVEASMAKLFVSETWVETCQASLQVHGGEGYLAGSGPERELRDALGSTLYSGTSEIQRNIIAQWLGL